jgi:hypothetical protein
MVSLTWIAFPDQHRVLIIIHRFVHRRIIAQLPAACVALPGALIGTGRPAFTGFARDTTLNQLTSPLEAQSLSLMVVALRRFWTICS